MTPQLTATLSIDRRKWVEGSDDGIKTAQGIYVHETHTACIFLDTMKIITVHEGGPCGSDNVIVGLETKYVFFDHGEGNGFLKERARHKIIRKNASHHSQGEAEVIKKIISSLFHEFIHFFLHTNNIINDCCEVQHHGVGNRCWLCEFTHQYEDTIHVSTNTPTAHPNILSSICNVELCEVTS